MNIELDLGSRLLPLILWLWFRSLKKSGILKLQPMQIHGRGDRRIFVLVGWKKDGQAYRLLNSPRKDLVEKILNDAAKRGFTVLAWRVVPLTEMLKAQERLKSWESEAGTPPSDESESEPGT